MGDRGGRGGGGGLLLTSMGYYHCTFHVLFLIVAAGACFWVKIVTKTETSYVSFLVFIEAAGAFFWVDIINTDDMNDVCALCANEESMP